MIHSLLVYFYKVRSSSLGDSRVGRGQRGSGSVGGSRQEVQPLLLLLLLLLTLIQSNRAYAAIHQRGCLGLYLKRQVHK